MALAQFRFFLLTLFVVMLDTNASGDNYFIDPNYGSDSNSGLSRTDAWKTHLNLRDLYFCLGQPGCNFDSPPPNSISLKSGDTITFMRGVHDATYSRPRWDGGNSFFGERGFFRLQPDSPVSNIQIIGEPGAVISPQSEPGLNMRAFALSNVPNIQVSGLTMRGIFGNGIRISGDVGNAVISGNFFDSNPGNSEENPSGIEVHSILGEISIRENLFRDNFDRDRESANSRHAVFFSNAGDIEFAHNTLFNTAPLDRGLVGGAGVDEKHSGTGNLEIHHNMLENLTWSGSYFGGRNTRVHHNFLLNSAGLKLRGTTNSDYRDIELSHNSIINQVASDPHAYRNPNLVYDLISLSPTDPENIAFLNNLVSDSRPQYFELGAVDIGTYESNESYHKVVTDQTLEFDGNVYHHTSESPLFNLFAANGNPDQDLGGSYNFAGWQSFGYDVNGAVADPGFDNAYLPTNSNAAQAGWYSEESPRLTVYVPNRTIGGDDSSATIGYVVRSGDGVDLGQAETVILKSSDDTLVALPSSVTFLPGQRTVAVVIASRQGGSFDGARATRVTAEGAGYNDELTVGDWIIAEVSGLAPVCDFDTDGFCGPDDINEMVSIGNLLAGVTVNANNDQYDFDSSGVVDLDDVQWWLTLAAAEDGLPHPYLFGDANLDGVVDGLDYIDWNENKFTPNSDWTAGDFNADGIVDGLDFVVWNNSKFQSSIFSVPEPSALMILIFVCGQALTVRSRILSR